MVVSYQHITYIARKATVIYVTMSEKRDLVAQNKKTEILMPVSRYNPPLHCVKTLNDKTLYARRDGWPNLPYSSRDIEVKKKKKKENVD